MPKNAIEKIEEAIEKTHDAKKRRQLCMRALEHDGKNPWLLTELSATYYQEYKDKDALRVSQSMSDRSEEKASKCKD